MDRTGRQYHLVTSLSRQKSAQKYVDLAPGETFTICQIEGAGRIVRFWVTLPLIGQRRALKETVLQMYWDGETAPSVDVPLGDFFGAAFGKARRLISDRLLVVGGAYVSRFEMPFNDGATLRLRNDSKRPVRTLFFQVGYYEESPRTEREPTFHAQYRRAPRTTLGKPFVVLEAVGKGTLAGIRVDLQARSWWLRPPFREIPLPRGFGLGILEGWEEMVVDGDRASALRGTGAEDYFSGGFYFLGAPFCTPTYGCTQRSFLTGRVSAYRFHVDDPIPFRQSLDVALDHGLSNTMTGDYTSVAYWYQTEPHAAFPPLPTVVARWPSPPWINPMQWVLLAGIFAGAVTGLIWLLMR